TLGAAAALAHVTLADGAHSIVLAAADRFNNVAPNVTISFSIKTTPPPVPSQPVLVLPSGGTLAGGLVNQLSLTIRTTRQANSLITVYRDGIPAGEGLSDGSPLDIPVDLTLLGDGTYHFTATAQDLSGNVSAASAAMTVTIDSTAPVVSSFGLA